MSIVREEVPKPTKKLSELSPESPEYWEVVLKDHGLGMNRGRNTSKLDCRGGVRELELTESSIVANLSCGVGGGRRVKPKGAKPE
jgi:hypothetical protein